MLEQFDLPNALHPACAIIKLQIGTAIRNSYGDVCLRLEAVVATWQVTGSSRPLAVLAKRVLTDWIASIADHGLMVGYVCRGQADVELHEGMLPRSGQERHALICVAGLG